MRDGHIGSVKESIRWRMMSIINIIDIMESEDQSSDLIFCYGSAEAD